MKKMMIAMMMMIKYVERLESGDNGLGGIGGGGLGLAGVGGVRLDAQLDPGDVSGDRHGALAGRRDHARGDIHLLRPGRVAAEQCGCAQSQNRCKAHHFFVLRVVVCCVWAWL
jgi:hypothetical protein